jgi:3-phosphoinositide dependent protein kinase-1
LTSKFPQIVEKSLVIKEKKSKYVVMEKDCLNLCKHPNIVRLFCTFQVEGPLYSFEMTFVCASDISCFQDANRLYFVMEMCPTDLFAVLKKVGTFGEKCSQFFAAEIVDVMKFIHSNMVWDPAGPCNETLLPQLQRQSDSNCKIIFLLCSP